jgi:hypothetical protein
MKKLIPIALALAACGGATSASDLAANAPTYDKLALSQSDADMAEPAQAGAGSDVIQQDATADTCHPHLFNRSHEIVGRMNRHFFKHLRHVQELIKDNPKLQAGGTATWENVKNGVDRKLTITATANADGSTTYAFELAVNSTKVMDGSITRKTGESSGVVNFDFTALHAAVPTERATGKVTDTFDIVHDSAKGEKRIATVALTAFLPEEGDPHGPRTGNYLWEREPGTGGSFEFQDTLVLLCPNNPTGAAADLVAVSRWYKATVGAVHGRADARAAGGQIAPGNAWIAVTCAQGQTTSEPGEGYWMMKQENASGVTIVGQADSSGSAPCDPALGGVPPSVSDNTHDFDFASVDFSQPYPFPNRW